MKKLILPLLIVFCIYHAEAQESAMFVGHRGASYLAPENTQASIKLAWDLGADAAECDIMLTKDNQVIIFHDKRGKRLTGNDFTVNKVNYVDIKDYPIILNETNLGKYSGETVPLLRDVLKIIPEDKTLVIEIKTGPEILPFMQREISEYWKSGQIAFIAFDYETIIATKVLYPDISCYYLSAFKFDLKKKYDEIIKSDLDGVDLRHGIINRKLVKKFSEEKKEVWCWTVDNPEDAKKMIKYGVTSITTNRPKWLKEQVCQD